MRRQRSALPGTAEVRGGSGSGGQGFGRSRPHRSGCAKKRTRGERGASGRGEENGMVLRLGDSLTWPELKELAAAMAELRRQDSAACGHNRTRKERVNGEESVGFRSAQTARELVP